MGNHTRKCSIAGCTKSVHGRGFCISHFSAGIQNLPSKTMTDECVAWVGRTRKFQEAARRSLIIEGTSLFPWSWVIVNCGSETCLNPDHLDIHEAQKLRYPSGICVYCGRHAGTKDHILPRHWGGESVRKFVATVPACGTCNSMLSNTVVWAINERREVAHRRAMKKYRRLLSMPKWDDEQLSGVEGSLRDYILDEMSKRAEVQRMLRWPEDSHYDIRYLELSGIEDPYSIRLLTAEDQAFQDFVEAVA